MFVVTESKKVGGSPFTILMTVTVALDTGFSGDPAVFVVRKLSATAQGDNTELVSVASLADMVAYGTTISTTALYRISTVTLGFRTADICESVMTKLRQDLQLILGYLATETDYPSTETVDFGSDICDGPFVFSDPGALG